MPATVAASEETFTVSSPEPVKSVVSAPPKVLWTEKTSLPEPSWRLRVSRPAYVIPAVPSPVRSVDVSVPTLGPVFPASLTFSVSLPPSPSTIR